MAKPKDKQPWFKFYPQDWRGDAKLRMCSIGARGLWAEMLCVMHEAEPYGYLLVGGKKVVARQMASLAGISQGECMKYLLELASAGVYSEDENKVIYSRRMVRDKAKAEKDRQNGKGGGNPRLKDKDKGGVNPQDNGEDKAQIPEARNQNPEPSSKKGESDSPSKLKLVGEGEGDFVFIDETYVPSERAEEYAFSLGMKKADLDAELSKFIALSVSSRVKSYNPDMNFKVWCDRWLEYKRRTNPDWKPTPTAAPEIDRSGWPIVVEGTTEHVCWNIVRKERGERPLFLCKQIGKDGAEYDRAARCPTLFPPGFNDFGERIPPSAEDAA